MILQWDFIAMEFDDMDICKDAPWHVPTGWDFGWVFMIIGIFYGTMCTSSLHLMEYCDSGMGFLLQWDLIIWIFVGTCHGMSLQGKIKKRRRNIVSTSYPYLSII